MHVLQSNFCCRKFILNLGSAAAPVTAALGANQAAAPPQLEQAQDKALVYATTCFNVSGLKVLARL